MRSIMPAGVPAEWKQGTAELLAELGIVETADGVKVEVTRGKGLHVVGEGDKITVTAERPRDYFRALSHVKTVLAGGADVHETYHATTLCLMEDMSRNSVMTVEAVKRMIRQLALMGYDSMMLYTEDTYELEGYPYFGYMRGRYTLAELREIDDYGFSLGIEIIPCIQTLAHLQQALQWDDFKPVTDTGPILLAGEPKTYELIEKMISTMKAAFRSKRINIGMDEAHMMGRGQYLDKNGYRPLSELMLEHLERVVDICRKYDYAPIMWSDMFFKMAGIYRASEGELPAEITSKIPEGITLVYWDYYNGRVEALRHMLECHTKIEGAKAAFAGGAWRWKTLAPRNRFSIYVTERQLTEARKAGVGDILVTSWGNDGDGCPHFSLLPTLLYYAEFIYSESVPTAEQLEARSRACFDIGFEEFLTVDAPNELPGTEFSYGVGNGPRVPCMYLLYNDPMLGMLNLHVDPETAPDAYRAAEKRLRAFEGHEKWGFIFENLANLCALLVGKCDFSIRIRRAYDAGDRAALAALAEEVPSMVEKLDVYYRSYRRQWHIENKPFGFEMQELFMGGIRLRLLSAADRIKDYLDGKVTSIPELEEEVLPFRKTAYDKIYTYPKTTPLRLITPGTLS